MSRYIICKPYEEGVSATLAYDEVDAIAELFSHGYDWGNGDVRVRRLESWEEEDKAVIKLIMEKMEKNSELRKKEEQYL